MKKLFLFILAALIGLLVSCDEPGNKDNDDNGDNENKTVVVFDNTRGICTAVVYSDSRRRDEDKIAEIPAGTSSQEIEWESGTSVFFYFSYLITLKGVSDFVVDYRFPREVGIGKDQTTIRVEADKTTTIPIPKLEETVSSFYELFVNKSYISIQNNWYYSFSLESGSSLMSPDNLSAPLVNPGERANWTIDPGSALSYRLSIPPDYMQFPTPDNFKAGCVYVYSLGSDGAFEFVREVEIKLENVGINLSGNTLAEKLQWLKTNVLNNNFSYFIEVDASEKISPQTLSYEGKEGITIILTGSGGEKFISLLSGNGPLFTIESGVTLLLDNNITLLRNSVSVKGGALVMNVGSEISGNTGRGVYVMSGGSFTMNGGEISGNKGGVSLSDGGRFTMNGGKIYGNSFSGNAVDSKYYGYWGNYGSYDAKISIGGGGVYVTSGCSFTMNGGEIFGNSSSSSTYLYLIDETVSSCYGGGVYVSNGGIFRIVNGTLENNNAKDEGAALYNLGTAQRGTFSGSTWNSLGCLSTTNNTIKVVNGVLQ